MSVSKTISAIQGLLWLLKGLEFSFQTVQETVEKANYEFTQNVIDACGKTLRILYLINAYQLNVQVSYESLSR